MHRLSGLFTRVGCGKTDEAQDTCLLRTAGRWKISIEVSGKGVGALLTSGFPSSCVLTSTGLSGWYFS